MSWYRQQFCPQFMLQDCSIGSDDRWAGDDGAEYHGADGGVQRAGPGQALQMGPGTSCRTGKNLEILINQSVNFNQWIRPSVNTVWSSFPYFRVPSEILRRGKIQTIWPELFTTFRLVQCQTILIFLDRFFVYKHIFRIFKKVNLVLCSDVDPHWL